MNKKDTGDKHSRLFPIDAVKDCLDIGGIKINDIDLVCVPWILKINDKEFYLKPALDSDARLKYLRNDYSRIEELFSLEDTVRSKLKYSGKIEF